MGVAAAKSLGEKGSITYLITKVFVEQPLALPGSAKPSKLSALVWYQDIKTVIFLTNPKLDTRISFVRLSIRPFVHPSRSGYPPLNLKRAGLESSGRRLISSIVKSKGIAFFFSFLKKKKKNLAKKKGFIELEVGPLSDSYLLVNCKKETLIRRGPSKS